MDSERAQDRSDLRRWDDNLFLTYLEGLGGSGSGPVVVVDSTGSMGWVLDEVKARIYDITAVVRSLVPISRFGVVAYRDKDDPEDPDDG